MGSRRLLHLEMELKEKLQEGRKTKGLSNFTWRWEDLDKLGVDDSRRLGKLFLAESGHLLYSEGDLLMQYFLKQCLVLHSFVVYENLKYLLFQLPFYTGGFFIFNR